MHDPWDVKSVRKPGQYLSCMKINGVPLLPPVLSNDCRREMQYYKALAKEVEDRVSLLKSITVGESIEDLTDATELPESNIFEYKDDIQNGFQTDIDKIVTRHNKSHSEKTEYFDSTVTVTPPLSPALNSPKLIIDVSLNINDNSRNFLDSLNKSLPSSPRSIIAERDYHSLIKPRLHDMETRQGRETSLTRKTPVRYTDYIADIPLNQDGPSSLSSKSFTGSLNDLHTVSLKENQGHTKLVRQRSYTVLQPSPQLLAYLENQSMSTGVDVTSISMSESSTNLNSPSKKRRSWDLETAKVKWSCMAQELKQKTLEDKRPPFRNHISRSPYSKPQTRSSKSLNERPRKGSLSLKSTPKSETVQKLQRTASPPRVSEPNKTVKDPTPTKQASKKEVSKTISSAPKISAPIPPIDGEDPATKVRELYEKIQSQQLMQMASLVEKQKKEQLLLQQAFEEQNKILYKQLKTIVPKSPVEAKEAWVDKVQETSDRGPVSLSQLINCKSDKNDSPVSSTLTDTNNYINQCNNVLKRSRNITGRLKKNTSQSESSYPRLEGSLTRTHSPNHVNTARKLIYDSSSSASDREYEQIPTSRTNDTLADINVTFTTDASDDSRRVDVASPMHEVTVIQKSPEATSLRDVLRNVELNRYNAGLRRKSGPRRKPTAEELSAACTIVAYAKGYLVRRLMRTERVQVIVQTIRDALLCALQLHQEREGIRGADVDLHRRLIQQITAACYALHDAFISSSPADRCAMIAADRLRKRNLANKPPTIAKYKPTRDIMSYSHSGSFPTRSKRPTASPSMTQSNYETFSPDKCLPRRYMPSPRRRPWR